jgi:transposase InsO family protein
LTEAARELGVCRELASRLRARFFEPLVQLIDTLNRPGPKTTDPELQTTQQRLHILEALLGVARTIIAAAGIAALTTRRRDELVLAVERLHKEHAIAYEHVAEELGLSDRTLRRLRAQHAAGESLAPKSRAPKTPHGKLPEPLAVAILNFVSLLSEVPLAELYRRFVNENADLCVEHGHPVLAYTTFARHSGRAKNVDPDPTNPPQRGRDAPKNLPFRALALMDTSDLECFGFDFKLIPFMEAHSREIFAHQLCEQETAEQVNHVLDEGQENTGGVLGLRVDRGTPYLAKLTVCHAEELGIDMRVARAYTPTDKAILERFFRTLKDALRSIFECIDLRDGPGDIFWRQELARRLASAVIAGYMRWGYPYIPQPYIDGRSPRERTEQAAPAPKDVIRAVLDERVQHHEHAQTVARELHQAYGFRCSIKTWLHQVRSFTAEDLREAARRFDKVLLRSCFNCDTRRTPNYLLAVLRDVAGDRRERERRARHAKKESERRRLDKETHRRACQEEERQRADDPRGAAEKAIDLAREALVNHGFGLSTAEAWLDQALREIALRGQLAYELATSQLLGLADTDDLCRWLIHHLNQVRPSTRSVCMDLQL